MPSTPFIEGEFGQLKCGRALDGSCALDGSLEHDCVGRIVAKLAELWSRNLQECRGNL